jgi:uncharacterized protein
MKYRIKPPEKSNAVCEGIIQGTYHGVLTFIDEGRPYPIPMNHAYEKGYFYFHCAIGGKKIECIKKNSSVAYTIMKYYGTVDDLKSRQRCHGKWESVIACGKARYIEDEQELRDTLIKFMKYYGKGTFEPSKSSYLETRAIIMEVERMTARRELETKETEFYEWGE